jgi:hypothetical protein
MGNSSDKAIQDSLLQAVLSWKSAIISRHWAGLWPQSSWLSGLLQTVNILSSPPEVAQCSLSECCGKVLSLEPFPRLFC